MADAGPLTLVRRALAGGSVHDRRDLARVTGLPVDVVAAALEHLVQVGVVRAEPLAAGCPSTGCGGCPASTPGGCTSGTAPAGGAVLLSLSPSPGARSAPA